MCCTIAQINSIANVEGKGRDDLEFEILQQAENLLKKITKEQSKAVRTLAEKIRTSFTKLRKLFRVYEENIEMVDPQLKNNKDLIELLVEYEQSWEMGKNYFLNIKVSTALIHFSHIIEATGEKYKEFQEQIECRDYDLFIYIPCLLILKCLDNEDKNLCQQFLPQLFDPKHKLNAIFVGLKAEFLSWKAGHNKIYEYYNILEKVLLSISLTQNEKDRIQNQMQKVKDMTHKIKTLSMELSRNDPMEWNNFLEVALV